MAGQSWVRKGLEAWFTVLIETLWPKQRILEVYLNIAEFGRGVYGVGAAADVFFRKRAARLNAVRGRPARGGAAEPEAHARRTRRRATCARGSNGFWSRCAGWAGRRC